MFGSCLRSALSFLLLAFSLPLLAVSFLIAALSTAVVAMIPGLLRPNHQDAMAFKKLRVVDQFNFEEGMSAYEELIGAHVTGARVIGTHVIGAHISPGAHARRQQ
jgi:hypothetical protein